jgi:NADH-quinone oxidoreductase subunit N
MNAEMLNDLRALRPELWLVAAIVASLLVDLVGGARARTLAGLTALAGTAGAAWTLIAAPSATYRVFGLLAMDSHADFFRLLVIAGTGLVILHGMVFRGLQDSSRAEFYPMLLGAALGGCLLVSTDHLLMLLLAMEMLSLPSYLLAGWQKHERRSSEAALKYLVYGALASAIMIFGFSLMYGMAGSLWMGDVGAAIVRAWEFGGDLQRASVVLSVVMVFAGIGFKIAAFPFHFWAPDVYEGSPTPVTTLLAVASKAAGFGLLLRFVDGVFLGPGGISGDWVSRFSWVMAVLSAVTMTYGNVTAVLQRNVKRLLAYSSISHAGYLLMGVAVMTHAPGPDSPGQAIGTEALLFYLVTYYLATLGAFACVMALANRFGAEETDDYNGLGWSSPWIAGTLVVFLASLTGLPPTAGFVGKLMLFRATMDSGLMWLAVVAALNSVVALFYYFKLIRALFLRGDSATEVAGQRSRGPVAALAAVSIVLLAGATLWFGIGGGIDALTTWVANAAL